MAYNLYIIPDTAAAESYYSAAATEYNGLTDASCSAGFAMMSDVSDAEIIYTGYGFNVSLGCQAFATDASDNPNAFWLVAGRNLRNTPFGMSDAVQLVDAVDYQSCVRVALYPSAIPDTIGILRTQVTICQAVAPNLKRWANVHVFGVGACSGMEPLANIIAMV